MYFKIFLELRALVPSKTISYLHLIRVRYAWERVLGGIATFKQNFLRPVCITNYANFTIKNQFLRSPKRSLRYILVAVWVVLQLVERSLLYQVCITIYANFTNICGGLVIFLRVQRAMLFTLLDADFFQLLLLFQIKMKRPWKILMDTLLYCLNNIWSFYFQNRQNNM